MANVGTFLCWSETLLEVNQPYEMRRHTPMQIMDNFKGFFTKDILENSPFKYEIHICVCFNKKDDVLLFFMRVTKILN